MSVAITVNPTSPRAVDEACMIAVSGADENRDPDRTGGAFVGYLSAEKTGEKPLVSERFTPSSDGDWLWQGLIFPVAGSWTVHLRDDDDDSSVASQAVTVQATA